MKNYETFAQQLYKDFAYIGLIIVALCLLLGALTSAGQMDTVGPASNWYWGAGAFLATFLFVIFSHKEMRAKRGLPPLW